VGDLFDMEGIIVFDSVDVLVQDVVPALSSEQYDRMLPAAQRNFDLAKRFLDPIHWMWRNGLEALWLERRANITARPPPPPPSAVHTPGGGKLDQGVPGPGQTAAAALEQDAGAVGGGGVGEDSGAPGLEVVVVVSVRDDVEVADEFAAKTLRSLLLQRYPAWRALLVAAEPSEQGREKGGSGGGEGYGQVQRLRGALPNHLNETFRCDLF